VIVLDSDPIVIDLRYPRDSRYLLNGQALAAMQLGSTPLGITGHTLLEIVGLLSFNSSAAWTADLPAKIPFWFGVEVLPMPAQFTRYAECEISDLVNTMVQKTSLGDAVAIEQIRKFIPHATCLVTWNARHFVGKLPIPVLTPEEWLQQNPPGP
jgi:hypothetical protein